MSSKEKEIPKESEEEKKTDQIDKKSSNDDSSHHSDSPRKPEFPRKIFLADNEYSDLVISKENKLRTLQEELKSL